jgi:hypothetical protein
VTPATTAAHRSAQPVVGISALGTGYRLVAADGGIFDLGGAPFLGSTGGQHLNKPMIGISATDGGYITVASDGGVFTYGDSGFYGSLAGSSVYSQPSLALDVGADGVTDFQRQAWFRVNMCEEGGLWNVDGPVYSGGLGFSHANWDHLQHVRLPGRCRRRLGRAADPGGRGLRRPVLGQSQRRTGPARLQRRVLTVSPEPTGTGPVGLSRMVPGAPASPPSAGGRDRPPAGVGSSPGTR